MALSAQAEEANSQFYELDIDALPLTAAVKTLSDETGIEVLFFSEIAEGVTSSPVQGEYTPTEALETMLKSTDLKVVNLKREGTVAITMTASDQRGASDSKNLNPQPVLMAQNQTSQTQTTSSRNEDDVQAQEDEPPGPLEEIIVIGTGTNIRGVENPTVPILQFDKQDIDLSGAVTVGEFLRTLPQNFNSETQLTADSFNPNTSGRNQIQGTSIDLRGLGAGSTLILLNGRRMTASGSGNFVDVSVLPLGAIERVDVLIDGASAIYGSDAVGGAINFITRTDFEGFDVNASYGTVTDGSQEDLNLGAAGGVNWGSGGVFLGVDYLDQSPLLSAERDFIDQSVVNEGATLGSDAERYSLAGSINQDLSPSLKAAVDVLYSEITSDASQNAAAGDLQRTVRAEQNALFVNSRVEYKVSDTISAAVYFDYGRNQTEASDSDDGFDQVIERNNDLSVLEGRLSGELFEISGGNVSFAIGALHRTENYEQFFAGQEIPSFNVDAGRDVTAFYGEVLTPIIGQNNSIPLVDRLELSVAGRYEDYSDFGDTFDPKVGIFWGVNEQFSLRASYSESFRAPDIESLARLERYIFASFPTSIFTAVEAPTPDSRLVVPNTVLTMIPIGGNPNLQPETAENWSLGFDYQPEFLDGLTVQGNFYNISYKNRLESIGFTEPLQIPAFTSLVDVPPNTSEIAAIFSRADQGIADVFRGPSAAIPFVIQPEDVQVFLRTNFQNVAERDVSGVDLNVRYSTETKTGSFSGGLNLQYMFEYVGRISELADSVDQINTLYRPVDLRLRGDFSWSNNGFTVFTAVNYIDGYRDEFDKSVADDIDAWTTVDFTLSYDASELSENSLAKGTVLSLSVQNTFDQDPPFVETFGGLNFDSANANPFGRTVRLSLAKRF